MNNETTSSLDSILNHPEVQKVIGNTNQDIEERRRTVPPKCSVFLGPYTGLQERDQFEFDVHPEARKFLGGIIDKRVQFISALDRPDAALTENFHKRRNVGIVFSGGPAPGGHNVIAGLYDAAKRANPKSRIFGFILGPDGILENEKVELNDELVDAYRNLGGFSMIKTGRTKIDTPEKMALSRETCKALELDALVIVGGDDSNTNAAFLAQELMDDGVQVIGVPKTIDGDVQVRDTRGQTLCAMSFGFHTAAKAFSENISHLCTDCSSDVKYWHICKVMGRSASHLALEIALQTHSNLTLIGEDIADYVDYRRIEKARQEGSVDFTAYGMTLRHLSRVICNSIVKRAAVGKNFGVIVIPEGLLEFVNEIQAFIIKLNTIIADYNDTHDQDFHSAFPLLESKLEYLRRLVRGIRKGPSSDIWNARDDELFNDIPAFFQAGLLTERDSHGNFQFSQVETDKVVMQLVRDYLDILKEKGVYKVGIETGYFRKTLQKAGLDPDYYGPVLFSNYGEKYLLFKENIFSIKTLKQELERGGVIAHDESIPSAVEKIYKKSVPQLKTQTHFYGYDGRGADPTEFDCAYTYNLGLTVFSLIVNGATGMMAAIKNLEKSFDHWEPIGIPLAPLMHLEERKGKLAFVIEKSLVDVESVAFKVLKSLREEWLAATPGGDCYRRPGPIRIAGNSVTDRPITLVLNALKGYD